MGGVAPPLIFFKMLRNKYSHTLAFYDLRNSYNVHTYQTKNRFFLADIFRFQIFLNLSF
jgi:hypothetical protein